MAEPWWDLDEGYSSRVACGLPHVRRRALWSSTLGGKRVELYMMDGVFQWDICVFLSPSIISSLVVGVLCCAAAVVPDKEQ